MLAVIFFVFIGCKKEINKTDLTSTIQSNLKIENGNKIRLTYVASEFGNQTFSYNTQGLMDEWYLQGFNYTTKVEYDENGKLAKSLVFIGSDLAYTVYFFYEKNQVVKEIWYNGNTNDIFDEVHYIFDSDGMMLKSESPIGNYYAEYEYTNDRQLSLVIFYLNNIPLYREDISYSFNYKNPFNAIPGLTYAFIFGDGVYYMNKLYATSVFVTYYDEFGHILFEDFQDPALTKMEPGPQNYPATASYYNLALGDYITYDFTYENCGSCATGKIGRSSANTNGLGSALTKFLIRDPKYSMKQKAADLRTEVRKFKH
jgi:hypothetical protein